MGIGRRDLQGNSMACEMINTLASRWEDKKLVEKIEG